MRICVYIVSYSSLFQKTNAPLPLAPRTALPGEHCEHLQKGTGWVSRENLQENMGKPWKTHGFLPLNREVSCKILSTKSEHVQPTLTYLRVFGDRLGSSAQSWSKIGFTDLRPNYIYAILWFKNVVNAKCKRNYQLTLFLLGSLCARKRWKKSLRAKYWKNMKKQEAPASAIIPGKNRKGLFLETPWKRTSKKMGSKGACCFRWQTCYVAFWYKYKPWTEERWCHSHFYKANHPFFGFRGSPDRNVSFFVIWRPWRINLRPCKMEGWQPNHQDSACFLRFHHTNLQNHGRAEK